MFGRWAISIESVVPLVDHRVHITIRRLFHRSVFSFRNNSLDVSMVSSETVRLMSLMIPFVVCCKAFDLFENGAIGCWRTATNGGYLAVLRGISHHWSGEFERNDGQTQKFIAAIFLEISWRCVSCVKSSEKLKFGRWPTA